MTYKELKVSITSLLGVKSYKVIEVEKECIKPFNEVNSITLFSGTILECEAFIRLKNDNLIYK